ncbi:SemiSWEET transporter [Aquincola sp. S2]|uniref:SemiSWEET transporter n=1 Tax=Pseudaquabacterium terrae TaxID=2732868 RepID=A0ABX2EDQ8_9BURK|nr:SemiSWEET transporter [Aquabacterium terrae]NRF66703.1 SemiSWEET transporter [Aquabacterium terrae]
MSFASTETLGYLAAIFTTTAFVPQVLHTLRTRDVSGISFGMYSIFCTGIALWLAYGLLIGARPVVVANIVTLALAAWILVLKVVLERRRRP